MMKAPDLRPLNDLTPEQQAKQIENHSAVALWQFRALVAEVEKLKVRLAALESIR